MSPPSDEKYNWSFTFHGDGALYSVIAHTYEDAIEKVRKMKPGDHIPKMVAQDKRLSGQITYVHPKEPPVDCDEENYLTSGWSGRGHEED